MVFLLRSCILSGKKLFTQEVVTFKHLVTHPTYNNILKKYVPLLQVKHFSTEKNEKTEREVIYHGILRPRIRNVKIVSVFSSVLSVIVQPLIFLKAIDTDNVLSIGISFAIVNLFIISSPILIYMFTKRYVIKLEYCPQKQNYVAHLYGFFLNKKEITFTPADVKVNDNKNGAFTTCHVKNIPVFFDENQFLDAKHFYIIMGYKKPSDFILKKINVTPINQLPIINTSHQLESRIKKNN
ncbi:Transmembrane protein 70-like protein, mitochondrial [Habropoda laboriosa]|uniref:Transmembrane protein 70-like protein, mitochondrial n=1 Tax=Habropoda laboriosa TaxID=597456 RepID=A0A0L7RJS0_9HYME|nr:PREDICTED: transmembrane protein 70 homolog, mitochondrial [Habropoda laboriosa]XP_017798666.1 PREDICTED: transmembrane protein 70 homolog, mitochondrial [Habropoda laboriosa]KOC71084.1 Transmembrane protein 70-like protein, mitochondrial [Habropoda laboriosa]